MHKSLSNIYAREDVHIVQERIIKTIECNFLQEQINSIHNALQTCDVQFKENMNELNKGSQNSFQFLDSQLKEQEKKMLDIAQNNLNMFEEMQKSSDKIEVKQIVDEMIAKVDNLLVMETIQNSKNAEYNIMKTIEEHKNKIMNSINEINNNKQDISVLKDQVNTIQNSLDVSGQNMSGMEQQMKKMKEEAKELEMKESVNKIMDLMINNVENTLTKERMDKMGQYDLNKMRESIIDLEDKYNSLSNTNTELETIKDNINQITAEQEIMKKKPKGGDDIKLATIQMLNNVEFENIYSILSKSDIGSKEKTDINEYKEIVDNKINNALEKIKNENKKNWDECVKMIDKVTSPEEIRKILNEVNAGIHNQSESRIAIDNLTDGEPYASPKVNFKMNGNNNYAYGSNANNQQDPGPDIKSGKSSKKSSKKGKSEANDQKNNQVENKDKNPEQQNEEKKSKFSNKGKNVKQPINEENKSKKSKGTNQSKIPQDVEEKKSKVSSKNKNVEEQQKEENESKKSNEKKSSKNSKNDPNINLENQNPIQESNNLDSGGSGPAEEEEEGEGEEEEDDEGVENSPEDLQRELKSKNEVSGKAKPTIKK